MNFIDLFAGAGGLSEGFLRAGYQSVAHVEMMPEACMTLRTREAYYYLKKNHRLDEYRKYLKGDISRDDLLAMIPQKVISSVFQCLMSKDNLPQLFEQIDKRNKTYFKDQELDLIIGGPPCQTYSLVGRSRKDMSLDKRNQLYQVYVEFLRHYQPKFFVFENVVGIKSAGEGKYLKDLISECDDAGYKFHLRILKTEEYGVLQRRRRAIIIGVRKDISGQFKDEEQLYPKKNDIGTFTVDSLLNDLPSIQPGETDNHYIASPNAYLTKTGIREQEDVLTWHTARPIRDADRQIYRFVIEYNHQYHHNPKYTELPAELQFHRNKTSFLDRFKLVDAEALNAQTMVAHISKDGHYYIHPDIQQVRSLSVREAARIQSFPDSYFFEGSRTSALLQIGNAVPPLFAYCIANNMKELLKKVR